MNIEIWDFNVDNLLFEIPTDNIMEFRDSGDSIKGVNFWSSESRYIKIKYYTNNDQTLSEYFFETAEKIINSDFLKLCIKCTIHGETNYYFIDANSLKKNYKEDTIEFKANDLLGLIIDFSDNKIEFDPTVMLNPQGVLETLIAKTFQEIEDNSYDYNLDIDYENAGIDVSSYTIDYIHNDEFDGLNPFIDLGEHEKSLCWQYIGEFAGNTNLIFVYLEWWDWQDPDLNWHNSIKIKHIRLEFDEDINYTLQEYNNTTETSAISTNLWDTYCIYFSSLYNHEGFNCTDPNSQIQYTNSEDYSYEISGGALRFSGTIINDEIKFVEETVGEPISFRIKQGLILLLLYNNLYIRTNKNIVYIGSRFGGTGSNIDINSNDIIEQEQKILEQEQLPDDLFDIIENTYKENLYAYYENFFNSTKKNYKLKIINNYNINILNKINISQETDLVVYEKKKDNDNIIQYIGAWK